MTIKKLHSLIFILMLSGCQSAYSLQDVASFPIPSKVEFAGQTISLERYDLRERFDREQLIIAYNHSASLLHLKRANRYFPLIESMLKKNGIPDDFKYLAVIESSLDPRAISSAQAAGIWQLMPKTAQELGLEVNEEVDERYHFEKATAAACVYFKRAYAKYNNWMTVAASYNGGMGRVSGELTKQQAAEALDLMLNSETSRYMFRLLAMKRFMESPKTFGYTLRKDHFYPTIRTTEVEVKDSVSDWTTWAIERGISYAQLRDFNVWIRDRKLVNPKKKTYKVLLPEKADLLYNHSRIVIHNPAWVDNTN